jgi:hypothetical protein
MPRWQLDLLRTQGSDGLRWQALVDRLADKDKDLHFTPDYAHIYELTYGQAAYLAVYGDEQDYVLLPFVRHDVTELPFMQSHRGGRPLYDIANVYGYGGPLARVTEQRFSVALYDGFFGAFHTYCFDTGIVDEYARLHPLLANDVPLRAGSWVEVVERKPVVYMDLRQDETLLWRGLCRGHRSSVNKARRLGVKVVRQPVAGDALTTFQRLYAETMVRTQASEYWQFPESYFSNCAQCLGHQRVSLFSAMLAGVTVASCLVIHAYNTAYYHFGASAEAYFEARANNLLLYDIALWAKARGYRWFHLGGGHVSDDSLFRFKSGFSRSTVMLCSYSKVHDQETYVQLCRLRDAFDQTHGIASRDSDFFPAYRR